MIRTDITHTMASEAIAEYGSISAAATALHILCLNERGVTPKPRTVEGWLLTALRQEPSPGLLEDADPNGKRENALRDLLEHANVPPEAIASMHIKGVKFKSWGVAAKGPDGNIQREHLWSTSLSVDPLALKAPEWPLVERVPGSPIEYCRPRTRSSSDSVERTFLIPDAQIGFWKTANWLEAMHDEAAIETMLAVLYDFDADRVIILGDLLDCSELSRYLMVQEFQETFQPALDYAYKLLAKVRSIVGPKVEIVYIPGNHERRVSEYIVRNAKAAFGIKRADTDTSEWPVLSVPHLLRLADLNIDYREEYPGGQYFITSSLVCQHAPPGSKMDMRASVIHGHHPQYAVSSRTVHYMEGPQTYYTFCIPGLMRTDDTLDRTRLVRTSVPSDRTRVSWCQGVGGVFVDRSTGLFTVEVYPITAGRTIYGGRVYTKADAFELSESDFKKKWQALGHKKK